MRVKDGGDRVMSCMVVISKSRRFIRYRSQRIWFCTDGAHLQGTSSNALRIQDSKKIAGKGSIKLSN